MAAVVAVMIVIVGARVSMAAEKKGSAGRRSIANLSGAISIPFSIEQDCQATLAIYDGRDQLVRILAQVLDLKAGEYDVAWDGLNLWGHIVPVGTDLHLKVITNTGVKAIYEMSVGSSGNPAWMTGRTGEGAAMRQGGNLGDHSAPNSVCVVGDRIFFGCGLAEHGHNLIATNLAGEKMWGVQLKGWDGPSHLATDGKTLFAVLRNGKTVYSIDPQTFKISKLFDVGDHVVESIAAGDGKLLLLLKNNAAAESPFRRAKFAVDFKHSIPSVSGSKAPEFQLSPEQQFATVFHTGGHFQTGFAPVLLDANTAYAVVSFAEATEMGSLLLQKIEGVAKAEFYVLDPKASVRAGDPALDPSWKLIGTTTFDRQQEVVTAPQVGMMAKAVAVRLTLNAGTKKPGSFKMCRLQALRVNRVDADINVRVAGTPVPPAERISKTIGSSTGWDVRTQAPITDLSPLVVTLDLGKPLTMAGVSLLNCTNPHLEIHALAAGADPATADESQWNFVTKDSARQDKAKGWTSGHINTNDRQIAFPKSLTTRALRIKVLSGILSGRGPNRLGEDPKRSSCADVMLLGLSDTLPDAPEQILQQRDLAGKTLSSIDHFQPRLRRIANLPHQADAVYGITDQALVKVVGDGSRLRLESLANGLKKPLSITLSKDRIAVGDEGDYSIKLFDLEGKIVATIGQKGPYRRGPYDANVINKPSSIAFSTDGTIWMAEESYAPKRMAQFSADGRHLRDLWGPPEYGGGGYLDTDLKHFYYRGMDFSIDWSTRSWKLIGFNDRYGSAETPTQHGSSFEYTHAGRIIVHRGKKYAVSDPGDGAMVSLLADGAWKPAAVIGPANGSSFLTGKAIWRAHWLQQDLTRKGFIWCDRSGDGQYQVDEVEIFDLPENQLFSAAYWKNRIGDDLAIFNAGMRLAPTQFTAQGVPVYESSKLQRYSYSKLAPVYMGNIIVGALAKRGYGGASLVAADGSLVLEGQPYRVAPDLSVVGGTPALASLSDYQPPIAGLVMDNPLGFTGSVMTQSPLGEIAMMNGDNGPWFLWSVKLNCVIGRIFTGEKGTWASVTDVPGTDVTPYKQDWECFFGQFMKADDGNYYVVAGKGHHAISRVEGLNNYRVQTVPIRVTDEAVALNTQLRPTLIAEAKNAAAARAAKKEFKVPDIDQRTKGFKADGELGEWGALNDLPLNSGPGDAGMRAAMASDAKGLYLAYSGTAGIGNAADDPKFAFKSGFCLDFAFRLDGTAKDAHLVAGDRRLLLAPIKGKWVAVLFDYVDPKVPAGSVVEYNSPVQTTEVARVTLLSADDITIAVKVQEGQDVAPAGKHRFEAEIFVRHEAIGLKPSGRLRGDVGVLSADAGGAAVGSRSYWANPQTNPITDMAVEAAIQPQTFGTLDFRR